MELQTIGARILAAFIFISILVVIATADAPSNGTTAAVSHNNNINTIKAASSANKGIITAVRKTRVSAANHGGKGVPAANHGKIAINGGKTISSINHGGKKVSAANYGKIAINGGKTKWSANHGKTVVSSAKHGKKAGSSANHVKAAVSFANHGKATVSSANHGKTMVSSANHGKTAVSSANLGKTAVSSVANHGKATVSSANHAKTALLHNNNKNGKTAVSVYNSGTTSAFKKQQLEQFIPEFNWEQQQYLKAHNDLRQKNGVPPLKWDAGLAAYAHSWAMKRRNDCKYRSHSSGKYGENSFWMQYKDFNPTDVVQSWFSEEELFDHTKNFCKCKIENEECECGHYLNVIGRRTTKMGCSGYVYCSEQKGVIVYCSYDPPTNNYHPMNPLSRRLLSISWLP